jgi:UrcA family protein
MNRINIAAAGLAVALTALIVPATARAASNDAVVEANLDRPIIYVSYADLNLADAAGMGRLNRRVLTAATRLCIKTGLQPVSEEMSDQACKRSAIDGANEQIKLAAANFGKNQLAAAEDRHIAVALR